MIISVIIPVYNEAGNLGLLNEKLILALESLGKGKEYEVIYVDDNSSDASFGLLKEFSLANKSIKAIGLARNFGQTLAIQAGIDQARGEILVIMDADLQNEPADIPKLLQKMEEGYDVVSGWRRDRKDPFFNKKLPSFIANKFISLLFGTRIHDFGCALKAYKRDVITNIRLYGEMHRVLPLYAAMRGASIGEIEVRHNRRSAGRTHYGWSRVFKVGLDLVTVRFFESYSTKPIYFFGGAGIILMLMSMAVGLLVVIRKFFLGGEWISPLLFIAIMLFTMGVQLILMGLLAEIIIRIYYKSPTEHTYIIKEITESK